MPDIDPHMIGFERESSLEELFNNLDIRSRFPKWKDFMKVARIINPGLCDGAFSRKSCRRSLRYIGYENWPEPVRSEKQEMIRHNPEPNLVLGHLYRSVDFNGATYTLEEWDRTNVIGRAYFEVQCEY